MGSRLRAAALAALALALAAGPASLAQAPPQRPPAELLRIPFPRDDGSLTPYTFELGYPLVTLVYDTVMWRDEQGIPRPWLARSVRRSPDGQRLEIRLRRGIRWHDGRSLTADDVAFTLRHVAERAHPRFTPQVRDVESVEVLAPDTLAIELARPSLGFLDQPLSDLPILPRHLWEALPAEQLAPDGQPVGSGPYRLVEHRPGERYGFRANRRYFRGRPAVERIEVPIIRSAERTLEALEQGEVDMLPVSLGSEASRRLQSLDVRIARGASYLGTVLMLNTARAPFDRPEARRAVALAIDLRRVAQALGGLAGERTAVPAARGYLHPASGWAASRELHRFDEDAARVAFAELGLPPIRVLAPRNDPLRLETGRQVVLALRRAGAAAGLQAVSTGGLARAVGQDAFAPTFDAAIWTAPALASHDPAFLPAIFGDPGAGAPLNYSSYSSARFVRLAERAAAARTRRSRLREVRAQLRRLARDLPVVPLYFPEGVYAYRPAVYDGWTFVKGNGILDKRSLLAAGERQAREASVGDPLDRSEDSGLPLGTLILAALLVLAAAVAWRVAAPALSRARDRR